MAYSKELQLVNIEPEIDIEQPTVGRAKTIKFRNIKTQPRWKYLGRRRENYKDYAATCEMMGDVPDSPHTQCHLSAAKLRGSPEYAEKVAKMTERRARVRCHEADNLVSNVRWCGCCTDKSAPEQYTRCCWCAEYGAPDMKPIPQDKWGSNYAPAWTQLAKKRKIRPHDKPCASLQQYNQEWPRANKKPATYTLRYGDPYEYTNTILDIFTYEIY
jgi:hypothetical protein